MSHNCGAYPKLRRGGGFLVLCDAHPKLLMMVYEAILQELILIFFGVQCEECEVFGGIMGLMNFHGLAL